MNILVTGVTGFIGSHVAQQLVHAGYRVKGLVSSFDAVLPPGILKVRGNLESAEEMKLAVQGCDIIIHCAAYVKLWHPDPRTIYNINFSGTLNLLNAAQASAVRKFVFVSSAGICGDTGFIPVNESALQRVRGGPYFRSKFMASRAVDEAGSANFHTCVVYPGRIYGPAITQHLPYLTRIINDFRLNKWHLRHPAGYCICSYGYVEDVAEGIIKAMHYGSNHSHYLLGGENVSNDGFFETLKFLTGNNPFLLPLPISLMRLYAKFQERRTLNDSACIPDFTNEVIERMFYNSAYDSSLAIMELGYRIRPLLQGIQDTIEHYTSKDFVYAL